MKKNTPTVIMLVGLPGTGKSSFVKRVHEFHPRFSVASTDDLIESWAKASNTTYDEIFRESIGSATRQMYEYVNLLVKEKKNLIWDQTNLTKSSRAKKLAKCSGYRKVAVVFCTPYTPGTDSHEIPLEYQQRINGRIGKRIGCAILETMLNQFENPDQEEGFTEIHSFRHPSECDTLTKEEIDDILQIK